MAKKHREKASTGDWLNTYADMVTLLLTFFVLLFSMSSVDAQKWEIVVESFTRRGDKPSQIVIDGDPQKEGDNLQGSVGAQDGLAPSDIMPDTFDMLYKYIMDYMENAGLSDSVQVESGEGYVFIRFRDNLFFGPDSSVIKPEGQIILANLGDGIKNIEDEISLIKIDGHTAAVEEMPNYPIDDRDLSEKRAGNVLRFFENTTKIAEEKLVSTGYGKHRPIADNKTADGRSQNRRVELLIVKNDESITSNEQLNQLLNGLMNSDQFLIDESVKP